MVRRPLLVFIACTVVILGLIVNAAVLGPPSGVVAYLELAALFIASIVLLHNLAMHILPTTRGRSHPEPGISERGPAYGVSPIPGGFNRIVIHLGSRRSRRDK